VEGAGLLVEAAWLALAVVGAATVRLGLRGFGPGGVPAGFGVRVRGRAGMALGMLVVLLGLAMMVPFVWLTVRLALG
jgi:hypothetical protein